MCKHNFSQNQMQLFPTNLGVVKSLYRPYGINEKMPGKWVSFQPLWVYFLKVYIVSCRHIKHYIKSSPKNIQSNLHNRQSLPKTPIVWFRPCLRPYFSKTKQPCLLKFTECLANRVVYKYTTVSHWMNRMGKWWFIPFYQLNYCAYHES